MRVEAEPRHYAGFVGAGRFDAERKRPLTESSVSAIATSGADAPDGLDWQAFSAAHFSGRRRHDLEALTAYSAYKRSRDTGADSSAQPAGAETGGARQARPPHETGKTREARRSHPTGHDVRTRPGAAPTERTHSLPRRARTRGISRGESHAHAGDHRPA